MTRWIPLGIVTGMVVVAAALAGCQSGPRMADPEAGIRPGDLVAFEPMNTRSSLHLSDGRYPSLFSSASHAEWITPAAAQQRAAAGRPAVPVSPSFIVIECDLQSSFSDTSIAYDVVGLRGIHAYLYTPDGRKIPAAQRVVGSDLDEQSVGALKSFGRTNMLVFPRDNLYVPVPSAGQMPASLRVVLEGYDSTFYFEWFPQTPAATKPPRLQDRESTQAAKDAAKSAGQKTKRFLHNFD